MAKHKSQAFTISWEAGDWTRPQRRAARIAARKETARIRQETSGGTRRKQNASGLAKRTWGDWW